MHIRVVTLVFACALLAIGSIFAYSKYQAKRFSFEILMGKGTSSWSFVQTKKDQEELEFYKQIYNKNKARLFSSSSKVSKIPKVIHFVWLGPQPFPDTSKKNVKSWMEHHPEWTIKFWTDRDRDCPVRGMKKYLLQDFHFQYLGDFIDKTDNYGEKAYIWSLEILFQEGGVYLDHDVKCYHSIAPLMQGIDFFATLQRPNYILYFPTSIIPATCFIGSRPGHPVLEAACSKIKEYWEKPEKEYYGDLLSRVVQRTRRGWRDAVRFHLGEGSNVDLILPASFLFAWDIFPKQKIQTEKPQQ